MDYTFDNDTGYDGEYYKDEPFYNALKIFILINTEAQEKEKSEK